MSKRMGRPPKPKAEVRKPAISVRFNDAELKTVQKAADKAELGLTVWATNILLKAAKQG